MGRVVLTPQAKQPFELNADSVEILGDCPADEYPLQKKKMSMEYLRTMPTLRPRTNTFNAAFRVRSVAAYAIHKFFQENGFVYAHSPLLTASDCEGAGEMFRVTTLDLDNVPKNEDGTVDYTKDFFEKPVNLTVSGQLEAEAMAMAFGKVYTFGPTFRAEKSFTTRHAAEFWMIEPEMAFCDLNGYMDTAEAMTKYVIRYVLDNCPDEMAFFNQFIDKGLIERLELVANSEFGRITYTDAIEILKKNNKKFQFPVEWGVDIQTEHERYLTEVVFKKPVFVTDYPKEIKSFYMKQNPDGKTVAAADMLVPGIGELIGGSQREEDYDKLVSPHGRAGPGQVQLRLVSQPAQVRRRGARRLRPGLRAHDHVPHGHPEHPRRPAVPPHCLRFLKIGNQNAKAVAESGSFFDERPCPLRHCLRNATLPPSGTFVPPPPAGGVFQRERHWQSMRSFRFRQRLSLWESWTRSGLRGQAISSFFNNEVTFRGKYFTCTAQLVLRKPARPAVPHRPQSLSRLAE